MIVGALGFAPPALCNVNAASHDNLIFLAAIFCCSEAAPTIIVPDRDNVQVVTDYTHVNTENSSVCVYVRARPPDPSWTVEDDDTSAEDKYQNPLQATLAGAGTKTNLR